MTQLEGALRNLKIELKHEGKELNDVIESVAKVLAKHFPAHQLQIALANYPSNSR